MAQEIRGRALIGQRFGNYVIEALIGAGGMGAVYRAVQPEIGKLVAIKFLSAALSAQPELVQRFFAEARAVNLIQHDNIVDIFDFGNVDDTSWFVMELLRGRSLTAALALEGRLSMARTVDICAQIADAIAAAHGRGIIHRDLKGDNVFIVTHGGREDFVKILDFGIAKLSDPASFGAGGQVSHTRTGAILGTPGYMSPEQGTGGTVDGRTDVYALGVIAYRMLAGKLPHEGVNHLEIVQKQLTVEPVPLRALRPDTPPGLSELVQQMLARQPEARPQKMQEVRDRLRALAPEAARAPARDFPAVVVEPTMIPSPTTLSGAAGQVGTQSRPGRRRIGLWAGLGGLLVAGGVVGYLALRPAAPKPPPPPLPLGPVTTLVAPKPPAAPKAKTHFQCLVETDPPGAQVLHAGSPLGVTPATLKLKDDPTKIILRLAGYAEEELEVGRDTEHAIVRLHKVTPAAPRPHTGNPPPTVALPKPPLVTKKPSFGLDD